jgi:ABC-type amino acid transport substrate-binding protein
MLFQKLCISILGLFLAGNVVAQVSRFSLTEKAWLDGHQTLKVGVVKMTAPILFIEGGQAMGLAADYLRALAAKLGLNLDIVKYNTLDLMAQGLQRGEIDLIGAMVHKANTPTDLHFTRPYLSLPAALYAKDKIASSLATLQGVKVSVLRGSIWEEALPHYVQGLITKPFPTLESALQVVVDGRVPVYFGDSASVDYLMKEGHFDGLEANRQLDLTLDIALVTHASTPALHSLLQKAMDRLSEEEIHEIWNNWPEIERPVPYKTGFLVYLLWVLLLIAWSLLLIWIVNKRAKQGLEHHRIKTHRSIKRLRRREELLKQKLMQIKHKAKRYKGREKSLTRKSEFMTEILPNATWSWDSESGNCIWEDDMFALTGLEKEAFEPTVASFLDLVYEQDRELLESLFQRTASEPSKISYRLVLPSGELVHLLQYSHFVSVDNDKDIRRVCICWRIDDYAGAVKRQHLSVVRTDKSIADEEAEE